MPIFVDEKNVFFGDIYDFPIAMQSKWYSGTDSEKIVMLLKEKKSTKHFGISTKLSSTHFLREIFLDVNRLVAPDFSSTRTEGEWVSFSSGVWWGMCFQEKELEDLRQGGFGRGSVSLCVSLVVDELTR